MLLLLACGPPSIGSLVLDAPAADSGAAWVDEAPGVEELGGVPDLDVFSETEIHGFAIELDSDEKRDLERDPYDWAEATFIAGDFAYPVGVRVKGSSTYRSINDKASLKIRFDHVVEGLRFYGMRRINLHNMVLDPMLSSEVLNWAFFRAADVPAPRVGYARLDIDGRDRGLYSIVEDPEDDFLARWFDDPNGNLYENRENYCDLTSVGCFEVEESDEGDDDALEALVDAADLSGDAWLEAMQAQMDWDRMVAFFAMERSVAHWDSYSFDLSNYRLYHDPTADTFTFLPWSGDLGFGYRPWSYADCGRHGVDPGDYEMGRLAATCETVPECHDAVLDEMLEQADLLEEMDASGMTRDALDRVREEAESDPERRSDMNHFEEHGACVQQFLEERPDVIRAWVEANR